MFFQITCMYVCYGYIGFQYTGYFKYYKFNSFTGYVRYVKSPLISTNNQMITE